VTTTAAEAAAPETSGRRALAYALLIAAPVLFAGNQLTARWVAGSIPPVYLSVGRWTMAGLILLAVVGPRLWRRRAAVRAEWAMLTVLGFLGIGLCGPTVYLAGVTTSATNIGLIYASSPVMIVLLSRIFLDEALSWRRGLGVAAAFLGVAVVALRGDLEALRDVAFVAGDLWILLAAFAWSIYVLILQHRITALAPVEQFAGIALFGTATLLPFLALEAAFDRPPRFDGYSLGTMLFLALVPSLGAYQAYAAAQRTLGAARTSLGMYLGPLYNAGLAYLLLDEPVSAYHAVGGAMILGGVWLGVRRV
jgi:drug/metabolite transporter (DMT)-like permease